MRAYHKTDFRNIWGASVLGIASSWAVFGFLVSSLHSGSGEGARFFATDPANSNFLPMMAATVTGGTVAGFLSHYKWLPAIGIALCMTLQLNDPSSHFAVILPQQRCLGEMIMLFISATFGQSLTRLAQIKEK